MQMPAKPEATARIVVFQHGDRARLLPASQPKPILLLNDTVVGEVGPDALYIQDVPPGDYRVMMAIQTSNGQSGPKIESVTKHATLNAGGEWFLEAGINYYNCSGVRPVNPGTFGPNILTAGSIVISFASLAAALATTSCSADLQLRPKWPTFGHQDIYPLLAKNGAPLLEPTPPRPDIQLPHSGLSSAHVERLIRNHFNDNSAQYKIYLDKQGRGNLLLRDVTLVSDGAFSTDGACTVAVSVEYLHVDEDTVAGRYVKRPLLYSLRWDDGILKVASWIDTN